MVKIDFNHPIGHSDAIIRYIGEDYPKVVWSYDGFTENIKEWINDHNPSITQPSKDIIDANFEDIKKEQVLFYLRKERDLRLAEADRLVIKAITTGQQISDNLKTYMQELRDLPEKFTSGELSNISVNQTDPLNIHLVFDGFPVLQS